MQMRRRRFYFSLEKKGNDKQTNNCSDLPISLTHNHARALTQCPPGYPSRCHRNAIPGLISSSLLARLAPSLSKRKRPGNNAYMYY